MKNKNKNKNSCNGCHGDCVSDTSVGFKISENLNALIKKMTFSVDHFVMIKSILKKQKGSTRPTVNRLKNGRK